MGTLVCRTDRCIGVNWVKRGGGDRVFQAEGKTCAKLWDGKASEHSRTAIVATGRWA